MCGSFRVNIGIRRNLYLPGVMLRDCNNRRVLNQFCRSKHLLSRKTRDEGEARHPHPGTGEKQRRFIGCSRSQCRSSAPLFGATVALMTLCGYAASVFKGTGHTIPGYGWQPWQEHLPYKLWQNAKASATAQCAH